MHRSSFVCLKVGTGTVNERIFFPKLQSVGVEPWQRRVTVTDCGYQIENWKTLPDGLGSAASRDSESAAPPRQVALESPFQVSPTARLLNNVLNI